MKLFIHRPKVDLTPDNVMFGDNSDLDQFLDSEDLGLPQKIFAGVVILGIFILWQRSFQLQVVMGSSMKNSDNVGEYGLIVKPARGLIYDRNQELLAFNEPVFNMVIHTKFLPKTEAEQMVVIDKVTEALAVDKEAILTKVDNKEKYFTIKENLSREEIIKYELIKDDLVGVILESSERRAYENGQVFSHILGYTGKLTKEEYEISPDKYLLDDMIGKLGIEQMYDDLLRGTYGEKKYDDSQGAKFRIPPKNGSSLVLTIDKGLQEETFKILDEMATGLKSKSASAIAIDPRNGEVLAMVNVPSFDNNLFAGGISQEEYQKLLDNTAKPLLNRCVAGEYAPASTVKPMLAAALLEEGIVNEETFIVDNVGKLIVPNPYDPENPAIFPDWKIHGRSDIKKAISNSVNMFFYIYGGGVEDKKGLGIDKIAEYYRKFGFGSPTGIDLPVESKGLVADPAWKKEVMGTGWRLGDTYHVSIGQGGMTATPLQLVSYIGGLAMGGDFYRPHILKEAYDFGLKESHQKYESQKRFSVTLKDDTKRIVKEGMAQTNTEGSGRMLKELPFASAGKTGTSQTGAERNNAWFVSYAPLDNPQIATLVLFEEGNDPYQTAVPATKKILEWYYTNRGFGN